MRGKGRRPGWSGRGVRLGDEPPSQGGTKVWRIRLAAVRCSVQREGRRGNRHGRGSAARTRVAAETGVTTCRTGPETGPRRATITASPPDGRSGDRTYMTSDRGFQTARRSVLLSSRQFSCRRTPPHGPRKGSDGRSALRAAPGGAGWRRRAPASPLRGGTRLVRRSRPKRVGVTSGRDGKPRPPPGSVALRAPITDLPSRGRWGAGHAVIPGRRSRTRNPEPRRRRPRNWIPGHAAHIRNDADGGKAACLE
jgi:hypothetical protein